MWYFTVLTIWFFSPFLIVMKIVAGESFFGCVSDEMRGCSGVCVGAVFGRLSVLTICF